MRMTRKTFLIPSQQLKELSRIYGQTGICVSELIRRAITEYIEARIAKIETVSKNS